MTRSRSLVFGASGQLGQSFLELSQEEVEYVPAPRYAFELDSAQLTRFIAECGVNTVIQCAAFTDVDAAESNESEATRINAQIPERIAKICFLLGIGLTHFSSEAVLSGDTPGPHSETAPAEPVSAYGRSKLLGEGLVRTAHPGCLVFRLSWLYSAHSGRNFMARIMPRLMSGKQIQVVTDVIGNPAPTDYIAKLVHDSLSQGVPSGLYNLGALDKASKFEFACHIADELGIERDLIHPVTRFAFATPARRPGDASLDMSKFVDTSGAILSDWKSLLSIFVRRMNFYPERNQRYYF